MSGSDNKKLEALVKSGLVEAKSQEGAKNALALLFPKVEQAIETSVPSDRDITDRMRKRRISLIDFSKSYFALSPLLGSWGQKEFEAAIETTPTAAFAALRAKLESNPPQDQSNLRRIFLELLEAEFSSRRELSEDWLAKLIEESPSLITEKDEEEKFLFSIDNKDRLRWLIVNGLAKLAPDRISQLVLSAAQSASDLTILADIVRGIAGDSHPDGAKAEQRKITFGSETEKIREALIDRILELARTGKIWEQASPSDLLWFWWGANREEEVKAFTTAAMKTPSGLTSLLDSSIGTIVSSSGNYQRVSSTWNKIVNLDRLRQRAEALVSSGNATQQKLAERFLAAFVRGQEHPF